MMRLLACLLLLVAPVFAQTASKPADPWAAIAFLEGTWEAKSTAPPSVNSSGAYTFVRELNGKVMARHSTTSAGCKGPVTFDCEHGDLLYIYQDSPTEPLRAIYFDSEGHTLHYSIATPTPMSVNFISEPGYGPQIRLQYELKAGVLYGKFQIMPPGQTEWHSYLEWNGTKR